MCPPEGGRPLGRAWLPLGWWVGLRWPQRVRYTALLGMFLNGILNLTPIGAANLIPNGGHQMGQQMGCPIGWGTSQMGHQTGQQTGHPIVCQMSHQPNRTPNEHHMGRSMELLMDDKQLARSTNGTPGGAASQLDAK